jgi:tetratricopeptide (TPR) repeat protein
MSLDSKLLNTGLEHHRAGRLDRAQEIYSRILADEPGNAGVLNLMGAACISLRQWPQADAYLSAALRSNPLLASAHDNVGVLLLAQNRFAEAVVSLRRAVELDPRNTSTQLNLANALSRNGQIADAIAAFRQVVQLAPDNVRAHSQLAKLLFEQGRQAEAVPHFRQVTRLKPDDAQAFFELADALFQTGQPNESVAAYRTTIRLKPDSAEACVNLAYLYFVQKLYDEAVSWSRQALAVRPNFAEAYHNLGCALTKQEKYQEAIDALQTAASIKPDMPEAYNNLGIAFAEQGQVDTAIGHYRRALALSSTNPDALYNLGNVYMKVGDFDAALDHFNRAIELRPEYGEARHNRSAVWLLQGKFAEGLPEYEWRFRSRDYPVYEVSWKLWNGESLEGRSIVLCSEQGLGDTLQFVRYATLVKARGARVIVLCRPELCPILARTPGVDALITPGMARVDADCCVPIMSLPQRMQTTLETVPASIPYLFVDEHLVESWRQKLAHWKGFKVGIVWQGNPQCPGDRSRSIPLAHYAPLSRVNGVHLFNLQNGPGLDQLAEVVGSWPVVDFGREVDKAAGAFMDTAAIMKNLDLVITSDTAAAHLAGALGVNVWVALQRVPEWRWMLEREDSPWYPTMRLFRQTRFGDWPGVFERIAGELERLVAHCSAG